MQGLVEVRSLVAVGLVVASSSLSSADDGDGRRFFESRIRPVLVKHCYECHSAESGRTKGGLRVDSHDALRRGGDGGPAVVPRSPERGLLYEALLYGDGGTKMPPKGRLPAAVVADVRRWIEMGAPDPRVTETAPAVQSEIDVEKGREFWAYRPVSEPTPPPPTAWARTPIDRFVAASHAARGLAPVGDADDATLVRRLHFVLTGLPPSPDAVRHWIDRLARSRDRQDAVAALVDELLASARYGERWGRHWMDVARFAESTGGDQNNVYQHAWRYRDWVVDAFNADMPYDDFVRAQVAGDLLPIADDREWGRNLVATGFLTVGVKLVGEEDQRKFFANLVDEQIDTTTRAFLATTVACARCHDHKFDPIPQTDYYALAGIFRSTESHYGLLKAQARQATTLIDATGLGLPSGAPNLDANERARLTAERDEAVARLDDAMRRIRSGENVFRGALRRLRSQRDETEAALQAYAADGTARVLVMGTQDRDFPLETRLLVRGEIDQPAQVVPRGLLQVLSQPERHRLPRSVGGSGRLELAEWIASERNPLTARVMANRVWHWMFGRGLVRTVDDFGRTGDAPTHPALLDHLARRLVAADWSVKALVREIALSRTWQLASEHDAGNFAVDPDNAQLWRAHDRRLEAEAVRDAMLAVSGELDLDRPTGTYLRRVGEGGVGQNVFEPVVRGIETRTRSVYLPRVRNVLPESLELFDAPDAGLVSGARETTSSPLQALFLMNGPFVQQRAAAFAEHLENAGREDRVENAYLLALGRNPTDRERRLVRDYLASGGDLASFCQALFCTAEFLSID